MSQPPAQGPSFTTPEQTSSRAARADVQEQLLRNKNSRNELTRKLLDSTLEKDSIRRVKLRIAHVEEEKEALVLEKKLWDLDKDENLIFGSDYKKAHRDTNERIISLGNDLWQLNRAMREKEEKEGKLPMLSPDSEGTFVATLLNLYKDPSPSKKRSATQQGAMRKACIELYGSGIGAPVGELWCPVSRTWFKQTSMKAAHIVPASLGAECVDYVFGNGAGSRLFSPDNGLVLHSMVETAFVAGSFVLVPVDASESPIRRWKIRLTNEAARNEVFYGPPSSLSPDRPSVVKLHELDGTELEFRSAHRPAARFLYYHFDMTLLRSKYYRQPG